MRPSNDKTDVGCLQHLMDARAHLGGLGFRL